MSKKNSNKRLNVFQRIALNIIWSMCWFIGHLPHYVIFNILARIVRFMIYRVFRYRVAVVDSNLAMCFPEKSQAERNVIRDGYYTILSEIIMSVIALTDKRSYYNIFRREGEPTMSNAAEVRENYRDRSWVALSGHFGIWEYQAFWGTYANQRLMAVYHPLENKLFDVLLKRLRNQYKVSPMPSHDTARFAINHGNSFRGESYVIGLVSDQNPPLLRKSYWYSFMGQDTIFFDGAEKIARRANLPVVFVYQKRLERGKYEIHTLPIWDGVEEVEPNEITLRYVAILEQVIREAPEMWLWSHRRWKAKRPKPKVE